jgi:LytS/YehU family sensor histidine kinase
MLLQPYVENAVWHGLRYKKEMGLLTINFEQIDSETVKITISDNGIGRKKSQELKTDHQKKQQSKGMGNIQSRISILNEMYQDKVDVFIEDYSNDENQIGTKVVLILKKD